jgi:hypothetical protein
MNIAENGFWNMIGAIATCLALLITILLEWPKLKERFVENPRFINKIQFISSRTILGAFTGVVGGVLISLFFGLVFAPISRTHQQPAPLLYNIQAITSYWAMDWALVGTLFGFVFQPGRNELASTARELSASSIFGFILGMIVALIVFLYNYLHGFDIGVSTILSEISGAGLGGIIFGFFSRGSIKATSQWIYGNVHE